MKISETGYWLFDTDVQIHRISGDPNVVAHAENLRTALAPVAAAAFSKLEFKGNYIQDLVLLARKVRDSSSISEALHRIVVSSDRARGLMIVQLAKLIELDLTRPWPEVQGILLTNLDSQVLISWRAFSEKVDMIYDPINCTRASESPAIVNDKWKVSIPLCTDKNTRCHIVEFFNSYKDELSNLATHLDSLTTCTDELEKIKKALVSIPRSGRLEWQTTPCRRLGDLIIGLHALSCKGLLSCNGREHSSLSEGLGYTFQQFPLASIRMK
jgi:hypothetical protein